MAILNSRANFAEKARRFGLKVTDFVPATGIGKFDAHYDLERKTLTITVKLFYSWVNVEGNDPWSGGEQTAFKAEFKRLNEEFWSDCYTIAADKEGFRDLYARVQVKLETVNSRRAAHYGVNVHNYGPGAPNALRAAINRTTRVLEINQFNVLPEESERRDKAAAAFKALMVNDKIDAAHARYLQFPNNSSEMPAGAAAALTRGCTSIRALVSADLVRTGFRIYTYGRTTLGTGKNRARAVAAFLEARLPRGLVQVVESTTDRDMIRRINEVLTSKGLSINGSFPGAILFTRDPGAGLTQGITRNYVVAVHECGHMFGLPDEYQGVNCQGLQERMDLSPYAPMMIKGKNIGPRDEALQAQAQGMANLLKATGMSTPAFFGITGLATTSIMYAGSEVMPAHYLPFWEALLNITTPTFQPSEWKIVPNGAGVGKQSNIELFAH